MIRYALPLAAAAMAAVPAAAQVEQTAAGPVVELSVNENVSVDPDIANISAGVTTQGMTAEAALSDNTALMERLIAEIERLGIDEDDIQTSGVNVNPQYEWDEATRAQRFTGYQVSNRVQLVVRDIARTGRVLDALVRVGATDLGGIGWGVDDPAPAQDQARTTAFATGRNRALNYARMAGYSDVRLLRVSEAFTAGRPMPMYDQAIQVTAARSESVPVRPGQVQTGITVNLTYEMVR
ncbi:SIMPL domain-containing protein [Aurantiacibacter luteus]|uniref:SIMPL domain-containing protein n=1 Tax=Aurantiacibacter luteus TaxID=1581420 RepID=UPI000699DDC8|nr:SIMPL domain-containing protein [Aurantiacibacter luteus]